MRHLPRAPLLALAALLCWNAGGCRPRRETPATQAVVPTRGAVALAGFDQLKSLSGDWEGRINGDSFPALASFAVTAKGTAVLERLTIRDPVEMVSVYHLSDSSLAMAHFCAAGNQPQMVLAGTRGADTLHFSLAGGSSLLTSPELHMHAKHLFRSGDRLVMVWETFKDGRVLSVDTILLRHRPPGPDSTRGRG